MQGWPLIGAFLTVFRFSGSNLIKSVCPNHPDCFWLVMDSTMDSTMDAQITGELVCLSDASDDYDDSPASLGSGCEIVDVEPALPVLSPMVDVEPVVPVPSPKPDKVVSPPSPGDADAAAGPPPLPDYSELDVVSDIEDDGRPQHEAVTPDPTTVDSPTSPESMHVSEVPDSASDVSDPMGTTLELDPSPYRRRLRDVSEDPKDPMVPAGRSSTSPFPRFTMTVMCKFHSFRIGGVVDEMTKTSSPKESDRLKEA